MSNLANQPEFEAGQHDAVKSIVLEPRKVELTPRSGIEIQRVLPHREVRTIGAWCFVDLFGPTSQEHAMQVAAHPHTGLQTVTWLFSGEVEHRDSIGSIQTINPGELNIMTAGAGISHSELSIDSKTALHGVQLWVVMPNEVRSIEPKFNHYKDLPIIETEHTTLKVFIGELESAAATTRTYSPLVGVEIRFNQSGTSSIKLRQNFEYGVLLVSGTATISGAEIEPGSMIYLESGRSDLSITAAKNSLLILLGGEPFTESIIMWWNFIGRSHDEIVKMREDWEMQQIRFGSFQDNLGGRIPAPPMPALKLTARSSNLK